MTVFDDSSLVEPFHGVCAAPYERARIASEAGRKIAGYLCTYAPEELLYAAGYFPVRVLGFTESTQLADGLMQSYACSLARAALDAALSGKLDFVSLMVFPHTCDTIQNLADIWKRNVAGADHIVLATPTTVSTELAVSFYRSELDRVRAFLESKGDVVSDEALAGAIALYNRHRAAMNRLYELRRRYPELLGGKAMAEVVLSSFFCDKAEHLALLEALLEAMGAQGASQESNKRPRLMVVGAACQVSGYAAAIEDAGATIIDDDLCTGSRAFSVEEVFCDDPMEALARMYMTRRPCPAKHNALHHPGEGLVERAQGAGASGVIFLLTKFCDPWAFDYPAARDALESAGIPTLLVEIEQHQPPAAQYQTRVGAFIETLGNNAAAEAV